MTAGTALVLVLVVALALVVVWNVVQSKRLDGLQRRIEALEKK